MSGLGKALLVAQDNMPPLKFDATNPHFKSKFVSLPSLLETVRPVLNGAGLVLTQAPCVLPDGQPGLRTRIMHAETGEHIEDTMPLILSKQDAQAQGSAITYARRYALMAMLGLAGDEDDDGNHASAATPRGHAPEPATAEASGTASRGRPNPRGFHPGPPQPSAIEKAKAAQEAAGPVPTDAGDPRNLAIHFGKNAGKTLGELSRRQIEWYANTWEAKPPYEFNEQDRRLKLGAQMILGLAADEIPPIPGVDEEIQF